MFSDPFSAVMALVILNFAGMLVMFLYVLRSFDGLQKSLQELRGRMSAEVAALEPRLRDIEFALRAKNGREPASGEDLGRLLDNVPARMREGAFQGLMPEADKKLPEFSQRRREGSEAGGGERGSISSLELK